jgi:hypothetical protein
MRRITYVIIGISVFLAGAATTAIAGHDDNVTSYTGCLTASGTITKFQSGLSPRSACTGSEVSIHLSGGDITRVRATGGGIKGGGTNGVVELRLDFPVLDQRYVNTNELPSGVPGYQMVNNSGDQAADSGSMRSVNCPAGKVVISGGIELTSPGRGLVRSSAPYVNGDESGWRGFVQNPSPNPVGYTVFATCATAGS